MNNTKNDSSEFKDETEALEFMIKRGIDRKRKEKWAKDFAAGKKSQEAKVIPLRKRLVQVSAIAAILVLGFFVVQIAPFGNDSLDALASNMIETTKFRPNDMTRGTMITEEEISKSLIKALEEENYELALSLYNQKNRPFTIEDKFFYAVSLAKTGSQEYEKILELTREIMKSENEFFIESLWISALTHLKLKDTTTAKKELEQLQRYKYQTKNVNRLLAEISS